MRLALLVFLVACTRHPAEPCVPVSPGGSGGTPKPAVELTPSVAPPSVAPPSVAAPSVAVSPPAACPPVVPPAPPAAGISTEALLRDLPRFDPTRTRPRDTGYPPGVHDALLDVAPDNLDQIVPAVHAVVAEPGNVQARLILACTLAQHGLHAFAHVELRGLAGAKRCPTCSDALANVADPFCGFDDKAREIVAAVQPTPVRTAAEQILASINSGDSSKIEGYLEGTSVLVRECSVCDEPMSTRTPMSRAQFVTFVRGAEKRYGDGPFIYVRPLLLFCDDRCCSGRHTRLNHTAITVTSICFRGAAAAPKLDLISALSG